MTEKELRKLNRYQLLELLVMQTERVEKLQKQLAQAEAQFNAQDIRLTALGSIAEASLQLNGVFEAAQAAADSYLASARAQADEILENARKQAEQILSEAKSSL
jgi:cell division septum initiation protein DivIVA